VKGPMAVGISFTTFDHVSVHMRRLFRAIWLEGIKGLARYLD
jgi:hypothetical protein